MKSLSDMMKDMGAMDPSTPKQSPTSHAPAPSATSEATSIPNLFSQLDSMNTAGNAPITAPPPQPVRQTTPPAPRPVRQHTEPPSQHRSQPNTQLSTQPQHNIQPIAPIDTYQPSGELEQLLSRMNAGAPGITQERTNTVAEHFSNSPVRPPRSFSIPIYDIVFIALTVFMAVSIVLNWGAISYSIAQFIVTLIGDLISLLLIVSVFVAGWYILFRRRR